MWYNFDPLRYISVGVMVSQWRCSSRSWSQALIYMLICSQALIYMRICSQTLICMRNYYFQGNLLPAILTFCFGHTQCPICFLEMTILFPYPVWYSRHLGDHFRLVPLSQKFSDSSLTWQHNRTWRYSPVVKLCLTWWRLLSCLFVSFCVPPRPPYT